VIKSATENDPLDQRYRIMMRITGLAFCVITILCSSELFGEDHQDGRHFNFNPGNMMGGMMNPMRNMWGGSNRDWGPYNDYYNYPNYAPQGYPYYPQEYAYPRGTYGQPPAGYGYGTAPSANPYPAAPGYYGSSPQATLPNPGYAEPSATQHYTPSVEPSAPSPSYSSSPQEQFHFRPMDQQPTMSDPRQYSNTPYQQAPSAQPQTSSEHSNVPAPTGPINDQQEYRQSLQDPTYQTSPTDSTAGYTPYSDTDPSAPTMKFRPLDKPGY
jgi:hypothetical protein